MPPWHYPVYACTVFSSFVQNFFGLFFLVNMFFFATSSCLCIKTDAESEFLYSCQEWNSFCCLLSHRRRSLKLLCLPQLLDHIRVSAQEVTDSEHVRLSFCKRGKLSPGGEKDFLLLKTPKFWMEESETWVGLRTFTPPLPLAQTTLKHLTAPDRWEKTLVLED